MPYIPLDVPAHTPVPIKGFISDVMDSFFQEIRTVMMIRAPGQGPNGSMQWAVAVLLLAATDSVAQLLYPGEGIYPGTGINMRIGERFQAFLKDNGPWELDPPENVSIKEACEFLWDIRNEFLHRFGTKSTLGGNSLPVKVGNVFKSLTDTDLQIIEQNLLERPHSEPFIARNNSRWVIWLESYYWFLRLAISRSLDTTQKCDAVLNWLQTGGFDPKKSQP